MAYDQALAERVRTALGNERAVTEKAMFGGLAFLLGGHMVVGVAKDDLMVRVGAEAHDAALRRPHARPMDFTGRPMKGYVFVGADGCRSAKAIRPWVERGAEFVATLENDSRRRKRAMARGLIRKRMS